MFEFIPEKYLEIVEKYTNTAPVKVKEIANALNIDIKKDSTPGSGYLIKQNEDKYQIVINEFEPIERQRFTIAHELAHFFLRASHALEIDEKLTRYLTTEHFYNEEREANIIAAEILMPARLVRDAIEKQGMKTVGELAKYFQVSRPVLMIRLGKSIKRSEKSQRTSISISK